MHVLGTKAVNWMMRWPWLIRLSMTAEDGPICLFMRRSRATLARLFLFHRSVSYTFSVELHTFACLSMYNAALGPWHLPLTLPPDTSPLLAVSHNSLTSLNRLLQRGSSSSNRGIIPVSQCQLLLEFQKTWYRSRSGTYRSPEASALPAAFRPASTWSRPS